MYGVDQCRVCGTSITVQHPEAWAEQEKANRHPVVPEKAWRARGYLAPPTRTQFYISPADGCCRLCGLKEMNKFWRYHYRGMIPVVCFVVLCIFLVYVLTFMRH